MSTQHVVEAAELAGTLDRSDVGRLLHHTHHRGIAPRIGADPAGILLRQVTAHRAGSDALGHRVDAAGQALHDRRRLFQQVIRQPCGRLASDARELGELRHELVDDRH